MNYNENKNPTHIVMVGFFKSQYNWISKLCVPFFNEESAVKYRNDIIENKACEYTQVFIVPYTYANG